MPTIAQQSSVQDSVVATVVAALITHLIFNRWEPVKVKAVTFLLLGVPVLLSILVFNQHGLVRRFGFTFTVYYATLSASIVLYRVSALHPLARYPGSEVLANEDKDGIASGMRHGFMEGQIFEHLPWLGYYAQFIPTLGESTKAFRAMCFKRGLERMKRGSAAKDLFYYLSNEDGAEKESPPVPIVLSDSGLAIVAGSDTTATAVCNLLYNLLRHPDMYKILQAEVDQYYPPEEDSMSPVHHPKMVYLEAVINETLRLYPVVPSGSQRAPSRGSGGCVAGQYYIPEGTNARIHSWSLHRDPKNFSHPESFYPDRWLIAEGLQESPEKLVHDPNAFIPFSFGPWNCVGKNFALLEMKMLVTHMLQTLNIRFQDGYDPEDWHRQMRDKFVIATGPLPIIVERRVR